MQLDKPAFGVAEQQEGYMSPDSPNWLALTPEEKKKKLQLLRMPPPSMAPKVDENTDYRIGDPRGR